VSSTPPSSLRDDAEEKDMTREMDLAVEAEAETVGLKGLVTAMSSTASRPLRT
jgi:hypothetical protein